MTSSYKSTRASSITTRIADVADTPIIGSITNGERFDQLNVAFTPAATGGRLFKAVSNPGGFVGTSAQSPVPVTGLIPGTNYTFTVSGANGGSSSAASASDTPTGSIVPIATSTADYVNFSNIPQIYQDLMVVINGKDTNTSSILGLFSAFNGNYGGNTNWSYTRMGADGSSGDSNRVSNQPYIAGDGAIPGSPVGSTNMFGVMTMNILDYTNTNFYKNYILRSAADMNGSGRTTFSIGLWRSNSAITSIYLQPVAAWAVGSRCTLYGVKGFQR